MIGSVQKRLQILEAASDPYDNVPRFKNGTDLFGQIGAKWKIHISSFDLVSTAGSRITGFSPLMLETDLYLIQNDDADLSGGLIIA